MKSSKEIEDKIKVLSKQLKYHQNIYKNPNSLAPILSSCVKRINKLYTQISILNWVLNNK